MLLLKERITQIPWGHILKAKKNIALYIGGTTGSHKRQVAIM
jgi:hypothetical protein